MSSSGTGSPVHTTTDAVRFDDVSKRFGNVRAVDHVDLVVADREFFVMLGPSGSGKTTSLRLVAGFDQPTGGRVLLHGVDVSRLAPFERDVNTVFQDYALFPHMSVADNVGYGLKIRKVARAEQSERIEETLEMVRLPVSEYGARRPAQLSGGQRQRVALARALINRPSVLLLDEPLGALDLKLRQEMQAELKRIQREVGITFIFVTHDQEEALALGDRLAVFNHGRIEQVGAPIDVYERPETEFVAGFVGVSNILRGEVAERLSGHLAISIRPEKIWLAAVSDELRDGDVSVEGVLGAVEFLGTFHRYQVVADGFELIVVCQNITAEEGTTQYSAGAKVRAVWSSSAMRPIAGDSNERPKWTTQTGSDSGEMI